MTLDGAVPSRADTPLHTDVWIRPIGGPFPKTSAIWFQKLHNANNIAFTLALTLKVQGLIPFSLNLELHYCKL